MQDCFDKAWLGLSIRLSVMNGQGDIATRLAM